MAKGPMARRDEKMAMVPHLSRARLSIFVLAKFAWGGPFEFNYIKS
jgi:hypothetical protein